MRLPCVQNCVLELESVQQDSRFFQQQALGEVRVHVPIDKFCLLEKYTTFN